MSIMVCSVSLIWALLNLRLILSICGHYCRVWLKSQLNHKKCLDPKKSDNSASQKHLFHKVVCIFSAVFITFTFLLIWNDSHPQFLHPFFKPGKVWLGPSWSFGGPVNRWIGGPVDNLTEGPVGQWTDGQVDRWTGGPVDRWTFGPVDRWTDGTVDQWVECSKFTTRRNHCVLSHLSNRVFR